MAGEYLENVNLIPSQKQKIRIAVFQGASNVPSQMSQLRKSFEATAKRACETAGRVQILARVALSCQF